MHSTKIAIIGAGAVGATIAYTLICKDVPANIALIDIDEKRCKGELLDLQDALSFCKLTHLKAGQTTDAQDADIIIITAGARQKVDQPRIELLQENKKIITSLLNKIMPIKKDAILIMVTNPVDILTLLALKLTKLPATHVFGSGTILDSMRLRGLIAQKLNISEQSIHAYIMGEHGDTQFPAWSISSIGGTPISQYKGISADELDTLAQEAKNRVYEIIKCKGSTFYGVASCVVALCQNIIYDQKRIVPLSCYNKELDVCISVPCILGKNGIEQVMPVSLTKEEEHALRESAQILLQAYKESEQE